MCFAARLLTRPASGSSSILTSRSTDRDKALHRLHDHAKVIQERLEKLRADRYLSCMCNVPSLPLKSTRLQTKITKVGSECDKVNWTCHYFVLWYNPWMHATPSSQLSSRAGWNENTINAIMVLHQQIRQKRLYRAFSVLNFPPNSIYLFFRAFLSSSQIQSFLMIISKLF